MTTPEGPYRVQFEPTRSILSGPDFLVFTDYAIHIEATVRRLNAQHAEIERLQARLFDYDRQWSQIAAVAGGDARHCKSHPKTIAGFVCEEIERLREENARLREATRWRSVAEELPPDDMDEVIFYDGRNIDIADKLDGQWFHEFGRVDMPRITHWQPLPEPPPIPER